MAEDTDKKFCSILFDVMMEKGLRHVVCSPGSRNAPLLIAAASRQELKKHFVTDERSAAFLALGIAEVTREPVALVCTSGTALLNYAPAIAEAYYQCLPLVAISADRPEQWIDQDDSQTLRQENALNNFVKKSYSLPAYGNDDPELLWYANRIANDAMIMTAKGRPGPVHVNIRFGDPLGRKTEHIPERPRIIDFISADAIGNKEIIKQLSGKIAGSKVMLVAGFMAPDSELQKAVTTFAGFPNVVVMAETISNLHLSQDAYSIDSVLTAYEKEKFESFKPDLIISIGGALVSRKLKEYLRGISHQCEHWSIGYSHTTTDCFQALSLRIETDASRFFRNINASLKKIRNLIKYTDYQKDWKDLRKEAFIAKNDYIDSVVWSELKAFDIILKSLPRSCNLFLSNGTSVRYAQIVSYNLPHASYCNRGVSGIDGSVSTAVGGALAYKGVSVLITGDLSMAYDVGALSLASVPDGMKIIVIDNQGGGIFRFIPSTSSLAEREEYFCMPPKLPLRQLADGYGWKYYEADDEAKLRKMLGIFLASEEKSIMRLVCDGNTSAEILKGYMNCKVRKH